MRDAYADAYAIGPFLGVTAATIRSWAHRHPDELPRRGRDKSGRTLYSYRDAITLRDRLRRVGLPDQSPCATLSESGRGMPPDM